MVARSCYRHKKDISAVSLKWLLTLNASAWGHPHVQGEHCHPQFVLIKKQVKPRSLCFHNDSQLQLLLNSIFNFQTHSRNSPQAANLFPTVPLKTFLHFFFPFTAPCSLEILAACKSNSEATEFCLEEMAFLYIYFCKNV